MCRLERGIACTVATLSLSLRQQLWGAMISPRGGRFRDERLREDSDPEEEVVLRSPSTVSSSGNPRHRRRQSTAAPNAPELVMQQQPLASPPTAAVPVGASAQVRLPSQGLVGLESVGAADPTPPPPVLQHNSASLWPRRRSAHSRWVSRYVQVSAPIFEKLGWDCRSVWQTVYRK